ncbi:MAG: tetratricopeptide repeat protein [Planctomycetota bacterium]
MGLALVAPLVGCSTTTTYEQSDPSDPAHYGEDFDLMGQKPPSIDTLHSMARYCAANGHETQCEMLLQKLVTEHPRYMPAYAELSELYLRGEMIDSAVAVLEAGLEVDPGNGVLRNNLGMCLLFQRKYEGALDQFTQVAADNPSDARSRANMAVSLAMLGRMDEAYDVFRQVIPKPEANHNMEVLSELTGVPWSPPEPMPAEAEAVEEDAEAPVESA